jgi:hypothetical protein
MNRAPAAPPGRLVLLGAGVLAAHYLFLAGGVQVPLQPPELQRFTTRTIAPPQPLPEPPAAAVLPVTVAMPPAPLRPPPRPRAAAAPKAAPIPLAAPEPQPAELVPVATPPPAGPALQPAQAPPPIRLKYELTATYRGVPLQGEGALTWRHDGSSYELQLEARSPLLGSRRQRSEGRITPHGLEPLHFWDKSRSEQAAHFDRERDRITFSNNQPDAPLAAGAQDRLSVLLQLAALVAAQPARYPPGTDVAIPTASVREAETWTFSVEREEDLALPGGTIRALKLQRLPRREYDQKVELWLAPRLDYAPVRIRLTSPNGDTVDQRWSSTDKG